MSKSKSRSFQPPAGFVDPRGDPDFAAEHWPLCNGDAAPPPGSRDPHDRRCIEFLASFYQLNVLNSRLLAARRKGSADSTAKSLVRQISKVTRALEAVEDRYAPIGFFGEPVMDGIRYNNVIFVRPALPRVYPGLGPVSSHIAIPGLDQLPASELRGRPRTRHFSNGKVDL